MAGILFDTSVYISALRKGDESVLSLRRAARLASQKTQPLWLSVVALEELLVGAVDPKARKEFLWMEREFSRIGRLVVPDKRGWILAGQILSKIGSKHGFDLVGRARMINDALIATSSAKLGLTVLTKNSADYQRIAEFRHFNWEKV
ncbi:MAG: type II toxin-antitoxin system VapC family toxin [Acidobacteriota bacterium]|nr:type II toxin-antitoxin system VapC family toxin [Acidobacteriota bacterium]